MQKSYRLEVTIVTHDFERTELASKNQLPLNVDHRGNRNVQRMRLPSSKAFQGWSPGTKNRSCLIPLRSEQERRLRRRTRMT